MKLKMYGKYYYDDYIKQCRPDMFVVNDNPYPENVLIKSLLPESPEPIRVAGYKWYKDKDGTSFLVFTKNHNIGRVMVSPEAIVIGLTEVTSLGQPISCLLKQ